MTTIDIKSDEVLQDVRSAAWLEAELHPELDRHRRHEMADICENGNIERIWRVLGTATAEIRVALHKLLAPQGTVATVNDLECPDCWHFPLLTPLPKSSAIYIKEKIHEYLVAAVMADRTAVIIPAAADVWQERADNALAALREMAATSHTPLKPVRRPMWPL